jgi:hypothetical protein
MNPTNAQYDVYTAEVEYRADRIRRGVGRNRRRLPRPLGRRSENTSTQR